MSEPEAATESVHASTQPVEPATGEPGAADTTAKPAAAAEPREAHDRQSAEPVRPEEQVRPARKKVAKPRRPRKRKATGDRSARWWTKVRVGRSGYQAVVGAVAALAIVGMSAYAFQDRPDKSRDDAAPGGGSTPPPAAPAGRVRVDPSKLTVTETGELKTDRRTLRVVSAPLDLTGKEQLAWAADGGRAVGEVRCTQNFRFNPQEQAKERPTMLMCWRTSPDRSVYAIAVDLDKRPSDQELAKTVDETWAKLG